MGNYNVINSVTTPTASHRVCLEASFSSLQSPCRQLAIAGSGIGGSSKTSSVAGSLFGRSQLNSILHYDGISIYDDSVMARSLSAGPSEAATVLLADHIHPHRGKSVAFDINRAPHTSANSPSPNVLPKSILHRQNGGPSTKKLSTLSFTEPHQQQPTATVRKIDFLHDDWYGMAPLASPETLSEISSISSRTSLVINLASSIDKYLHRIGGQIIDQSQTFLRHGNSADIDTAGDEDAEVFKETQMITPKVMRRTPKVSGNLSMCADDWKTVESYKRMGQVFITNPCVPSISDSSEESFEASFGFGGSLAAAMATKKSASAENSHSIENSSNDALNDCTSDCPKCPCKNRSTVTAIECCHRHDHAACKTNGDQRAVISMQTASPTNNADISSTSFANRAPNDSMTSSTDAIDHANGLSAAQVKAGVLESHFPVFNKDDRKINEKSSLIPIRTNRQVKIVPKKGGASKAAANKRHMDSEDRAFSRNESLPLLSNLNEKSSPSRFVKRKKSVFPMESSPRPSPSKKKSESSV